MENSIISKKIPLKKRKKIDFVIFVLMTTCVQVSKTFNYTKSNDAEKIDNSLFKFQRIPSQNLTSVKFNALELVNSFYDSTKFYENFDYLSNSQYPIYKPSTFNNKITSNFHPGLMQHYYIKLDFETFYDYKNASFCTVDFDDSINGTIYHTPDMSEKQISVICDSSNQINNISDIVVYPLKNFVKEM